MALPLDLQVSVKVVGSSPNGGFLEKEGLQRRRHIDHVNSHVWADSLNGRCPGPVTA